MSELPLTLDNPANKTAAVFWVGIDVAKESFDAAIHPPLIPGERPDLASLAVKSFARTGKGVAELLAWIDAAVGASDLDREQFDPKVRALMESTGKYSLELAAWMTAARVSLCPAIVNAGFIAAHGKSLGQRNKTDRTDARVIARFGAERSPEPTPALSPARAELRELTRERQAIVAERVAWNERAREGSASKLVSKMRLKHMTQLEKFEEQLETAIKDLVFKTPEFKKDMNLLTSIPGVGLVTAATVLAELGDLRQFKRARSLSAFVGLSPRQHRSGTSINGRTRMSKKGNGRVRAALYMAAMVATRGDTDLARYYQGLVARGKSKMAALGAVMRKLLVLMRALAISNSNYNENHEACAKTCEQPVEKSDSRCATLA